jgi:hypothetical protein
MNTKVLHFRFLALQDRLAAVPRITASNDFRIPIVMPRRIVPDWLAVCGQEEAKSAAHVSAPTLS